MNPGCFVRIAGACLIALIICGCETLPQGPFPRATEVGWWNDEGASGPARIVVHIGEQKAYFYKGRHLVGQTVISSGKPGFSTPPGRYTVTQKDTTSSGVSERVFIKTAEGWRIGVTTAFGLPAGAPAQCK